MGQAITVATRQGTRPEVRIFDLDRSLTGMEIERFTSASAPTGSRLTDVLARKLLELGADALSIYSNEVIAQAPAEKWETLEPVIIAALEELFTYYLAEVGPDPAAPSR